MPARRVSLLRSYPPPALSMLLYILLAGGLHTSLAVSLAGVGPRPVVNTTGSSWVGKTDLLGKIDSFLGIPYAQPPVGCLLMVLVQLTCIDQRRF